jgi:hypothetical protein
VVDSLHSLLDGQWNWNGRLMRPHPVKLRSRLIVINVTCGLVDTHRNFGRTCYHSFRQRRMICGLLLRVFTYVDVINLPSHATVVHSQLRVSAK